ncbi:MAG: hypothetical protein Q8P12_04965 [bacterium]|nr:hypothetical protein [bacterium]
MMTEQDLLEHFALLDEDADPEIPLDEVEDDVLEDADEEDDDEDDGDVDWSKEE